MANPW